MLDWDDAEYRKLNTLVRDRVPKNKYVSINDNHGLGIALSLAYHVNVVEPKYTPDNLRSLKSAKIRDLCPDITLISKHTHADLNYRCNGENRWMYRTGFPPMENGNQMAVWTFVEKFTTTDTTKRRSIGTNEGERGQLRGVGTRGGSSSQKTSQTPQPKRQKVDVIPLSAFRTLGRGYQREGAITDLVDALPFENLEHVQMALNRRMAKHRRIEGTAVRYPHSISHSYIWNAGETHLLFQLLISHSCF